MAGESISCHLYNTLILLFYCPVRSKIVTQCYVRNWLVGITVINSPGVIKFGIEAKQCRSHPGPIAHQVRVFIVGNRCPEWLVFIPDDLGVQAVILAKWTFARPSGPNIAKADDLEVAQEARCDRATVKVFYQRDSQFGVKQHVACAR
ncbi:hypothetical protein D3C86_1676270 [compost metagenome]